MLHNLIVTEPHAMWSINHAIVKLWAFVPLPIRGSLDPFVERIEIFDTKHVPVPVFVSNQRIRPALLLHDKDLQMPTNVPITPHAGRTYFRQKTVTISGNTNIANPASLVSNAPIAVKNADKAPMTNDKMTPTPRPINNP
jgi:hypothetical protein